MVMASTIHLAGRNDQKAIPRAQRRKRSGERITRLIRKECETALWGDPGLVLGCATRRLGWMQPAETEAGDMKDRGRHKGDPSACVGQGRGAGPRDRACR